MLGEDMVGSHELTEYSKSLRFYLDVENHRGLGAREIEEVEVPLHSLLIYALGTATAVSGRE